jgi:pimeloyl-ACP methyl ester carboxylesterase
MEKLQMGSLWFHARCFVALFALLLPFQRTIADTVEAKLPTGIIATADFRAGQPSRPAVLLLHGFLQTRHAPPMSSLANALADQGYTVLTPSLTLGINRRAKSLACEAVHAHTMDGDIAEISFWTNWLANKGYGSIALVGHSIGSTQILRYASRKPNRAVKKAILTSLVPFQGIRQEVQNALTQTKRPVSEQALGRFTLTYCNNSYVAPPAAYLSYVANDTEQALGLLGKIKVPVEVILGSIDKTIATDWPEKIQNRGVPVIVIDKANHFFDGEHEFDLADKVEAILKTLSAGNK